MADTYKILGTVTDASSEQTIYTVPSGYGCVVSRLYICNKNAVSKTFTVTVTPAGGSAVECHYTESLAASNSTQVLKGATLSNGDVIKVTSNSADVKFILFGDEFNQTNVYAP